MTDADNERTRYLVEVPVDHAEEMVDNLGVFATEHGLENDITITPLGKDDEGSMGLKTLGPTHDFNHGLITWFNFTGSEQPTPVATRDDVVSFTLSEGHRVNEVTRLFHILTSRARINWKIDRFLFLDPTRHMRVLGLRVDSLGEFVDGVSSQTISVNGLGRTTKTFETLERYSEALFDVSSDNT